MTLPRARVFASAVLIAGLFGCASSNSLHRYDYRDRTLTVVSEIPRRPDVLTGPYFPSGPSGDPVRDIVRVGARVAREVEARAVQERLDSAAVLVDVGHVLEDATLERASRYLGTDAAPGDPDADYTLELIVVEYGIDAQDWEAAAHFYIEADATLLDTGSGEEIWREEIEAREAIGPLILGGRRTVRDVVTAAMLSSLDVEEIAEVLESLGEFAARQITDRLRDDLREARDR